MLEALPRNPKATGKKLLGTEERTGVSGGPGGEEEDIKTDKLLLRGSDFESSWESSPGDRHVLGSVGRCGRVK